MPLPGKPLSPIPEPNGAGHLTQSKAVSGPPGALMPCSNWELIFLHWEERGWVKLQCSGRTLECFPQWESILGGVYDPGQEASCEAAVECLTITRPIKHLGRAAPATRSTKAPTSAPQGTPPSAATNVRTALGTWGPSDQSQILQYVRA